MYFANLTDTKEKPEVRGFQGLRGFRGFRVLGLQGSGLGDLRFRISGFGV